MRIRLEPKDSAAPYLLRVTFCHPPDYFPEPAFWAAALRSDTVLLLSGAQYVRQSRHNRARIRTPEGTQWLTIPVGRGQLGRSIAETVLAPRSDWRRTHLKAFKYNYGKTPFYEHYIDDLAQTMPAEAQAMDEVSVPLILLLARWLGCRADFEIRKGEDRALGEPLWEVGEEEIHVACRIAPYRQAFPGFEPGLSTIDLLFNHGPSAREMILGGSKALDERRA